MRLILTRDTKFSWAPAQSFLVQQIDFTNGHNVLRVTWLVIILLNSDSLLRERLSYSWMKEG